ncbi:MAG: ABC transporter substrate-binding protein [Peptoniphilus sp.]|nr:ABC transporter substrate-binding protein [Peptoniphilus sp.]MDY3118685.1 ABC transporter substrate-binding protein [Peptoniphilus sp.]
MKRYFLLLLSIGLLLLTACGKEQRKKETIHVYNWGDYVDMDTIRQFEKETGIQVIYDTFASNEDLYVKLKKSNDPYDVVVPSEYMIERMIREDMLMPLNYDLIPNMKKLDKRILNMDYDPGNKYSVPYLWGTLGIVVNTDYVKENIDSWSALWDKKYKNEVIMYNSQRDSIAIALKYLGYSMNSRSMKELEEAKDALIAQKPLVYAYLADEGRDVMSQGDAALSVMYSGDAAMMREENSSLQYVIPKEGTNIWYDSFAVPKNANNPEAAMEFINFMSRPDIAAKNAEHNVGYATPIPEAIALLPKEMQEDPVAYPDLDRLPPLEVYRDLSDFVEIYDRIWTEVTAR